MSVAVHSGNTGDPTTLMPQVKRVKEHFKIDDVVLVGDRGLITQKQIDQLKGMEGINWITALRSAQIRNLMEDETIPFSLFDERDLFEVTHLMSDN